jgi:hypothetical protein
MIIRFQLDGGKSRAQIFVEERGWTHAFILFAHHISQDDIIHYFGYCGHPSSPQTAADYAERNHTFLAGQKVRRPYTRVRAWVLMSTKSGAGAEMSSPVHTVCALLV